MRPGDEVVIQTGPYATRRGVVLGDTDPDAGRVRIRVDDGMEALVHVDDICPYCSGGVAAADTHFPASVHATPTQPQTNVPSISPCSALFCDGAHEAAFDADLLGLPDCAAGAVSASFASDLAVRRGATRQHSSKRADVASPASSHEAKRQRSSSRAYVESPARSHEARQHSSKRAHVGSPASSHEAKRQRSSSRAYVESPARSHEKDGSLMSLLELQPPASEQPRWADTDELELVQDPGSQASAFAEDPISESE